MAVDAKHPDYDHFIDDWTLLRDCAAGERTVKLRDQTYLPIPSGFKEQEDGGVEYYLAYQTRAQYPDILQPTLQGMIGVIHRVEAQIEGLDEDKPLAPLWERATQEGLTLEAFHRQITSELLLMGRYAVLADVPSGDANATVKAAGKPGQPYLVGYTTEQLINWSDPDKDLFVLDESRKVRGVGDEFSWIDETRYLALRLTDGKYTAQRYNRTTYDQEPLINPQVSGGKPMTEIPLVVVGPRAVAMDLEPSPLMGVAKASLAIFRLDADYRHQLFWSGQETLFIIGEVENIPKTTGAGVIWGLPAGSSVQYAGMSGTGIEAHRTAITDERQNAVAAGVRLFDTQKQAESGEALRLRAAAQTATLTTIALASAAALEKALRYCAMFVGQDPAEIVVKPNLAFVDTKMSAQEANQLVSVWQSGAISKTSLYEAFQRGEIVSAERTFEEEQELIAQEALDQPMSPMEMFPAGPIPGGPTMPQGPGRLNGSSDLMRTGNIPDRFIETGEGLTIEEG